ncbi:MAG TPA: hypothetical protein VN374_06645 [Desulfitobacteriaceae bacterium]|nr:hypothetical protein [Desulfitobacteriaceae bacterium]
MGLHGKVIAVKLLTAEDKKIMFSLMEEFYDNTSFSVFNEDLNEKDYCILLYAADNQIKGFSTQKIMAVESGPDKVYGVFSGDTIIHKAYWGSLELYKLFAAYFTNYGQRYKNFYWFLISKGYKTYKMLPLFFKEFYPNYQKKTPFYEQQIINSWARAKYPEEYDRASGVIVYKGIKDKLKAGVADITAKQLKDKDVVYFLKLNPHYYMGNDLVCLTRLTEDNLKPAVRRLLLGK